MTSAISIIILFVLLCRTNPREKYCATTYTVETEGPLHIYVYTKDDLTYLSKNIILHMVSYICF